MSTDVMAQLHSPARLVVVEAPAGCGKTTCAAAYATEALGELGSAGRVLLLSHTHAACGEFAKKSAASRGRIAVDTCDSFCLKLIQRYAQPLDLPAPIEDHIERPGSGVTFRDLSRKARELLSRSPSIAKCVAAQFPLIILDEHQDANTDQHEVAMLLHNAGGARLRIFGDPMQALHQDGDAAQYVDWPALLRSADVTGILDTPHRWSQAPELGRWILQCRGLLQSGNPISLRVVPSGFVSVSRHNGIAGRTGLKDIQTAQRILHNHWNQTTHSSVALAYLRDMTKTLAKAGRWRALMNEGAQLDYLSSLISAMEAHEGDAARLCRDLLGFVQEIGVGLTNGDRSALERRIGSVLDRRRAGRIQLEWLDAIAPIYTSPDHRGVAAAMRAINSNPPFGYTVRLHDHGWALASLGQTDSPRSFQSTLSRIRRQRQPPSKSVSSIGKAKGMEFDHVLLLPVDAHQYPSGGLGARLLYVALSRAKRSVRLTIGADNPSQHVT